MTGAEEDIWMQGRRSAYTRILQEACGALGYDDPASKAAAWILEREAAVAMLRIECRVFGDNDWPDTLNLADVIEKHLCRHLEQ